jgi:PBP1b-binding outer membrane lipoprotein LpoB
MEKLKCQALVLVMCASFLPLIATSQSVSPKPPNLIETLNKEAEANDPEGFTPTANT